MGRGSRCGVSRAPDIYFTYFFYTTSAYLGLITLQFNTVGSKLAGIGCGSRRIQVCFFLLLILFLIILFILTKTDTLCRLMEVAGPEKGWQR